MDREYSNNKNSSSNNHKTTATTTKQYLEQQPHDPEFETAPSPYLAAILRTGPLSVTVVAARVLIGHRLSKIMAAWQCRGIPLNVRDAATFFGMQERVDPLSVMVPRFGKRSMLNDLNMHITVQDDALMQQAVCMMLYQIARGWGKMWHGGYGNGTTSNT
jgi:hypothetical protein